MTRTDTERLALALAVMRAEGELLDARNTGADTTLIERRLDGLRREHQQAKGAATPARWAA